MDQLLPIGPATERGVVTHDFPSAGGPWDISLRGSLLRIGAIIRQQQHRNEIHEALSDLNGPTRPFWRYFRARPSFVIGNSL
jgi:hypothetical protein